MTVPDHRSMTVEDERPEFVKCIHGHGLGSSKFALCGRFLGFEFYFVDAAHAFQERAREGRLLVCDKCAAVVASVLCS